MKTIFIIMLTTIFTFGQEIQIGGVEINLNMAKDEIISLLEIINSNSFKYGEDSNFVSISMNGDYVGTVYFENKKPTLIIKNWGVYSQTVDGYEMLFEIFDLYGISNVSLSLKKNVQPDNRKDKRIVFEALNRTIEVMIFSKNIQIIEFFTNTEF